MQIQRYVETSAQWYMANYFPEERDTFMEVVFYCVKPTITMTMINLKVNCDHCLYLGHFILMENDRC